MILSPYLDTAISIFFLLLIFSQIASQINEQIIKRYNYRGRFLRKMLDRVLNDSENRNFAALLYEHPIIRALYKNDRSLPVYIPNQFFSKALVETIAEQHEIENLKFVQNKETNEIVEEVEPSSLDVCQKCTASINGMQQGPLKKIFQSFIINSNEKGLTTEKLLGEVENWFDTYMNQCSYWYKSKLRWNLFFISIAIAIFANFSIIHTTTKIFQDDLLREEISSLAEEYVENTNNANATNSEGKQLLKELREEIDLPIGWGNSPMEYYKANIGINNLPLYLLGWFLSAVLISFGAPFWFEVLNKTINYRKSSKN